MTFARPGPNAGMITPRSAQPPSAPRHRTLARLIGALGLVVLTATLYWLLTDDAFTVDEERVSFRGLAHADEAEVRELLAAIDRGPNVFRVRASDIVDELSTLTEVDAASALVTLPADVSVTLDERDPVFIWSDGAVSWLVDEEGMLFAPADLDAPVAEEDDSEVETTNDARGRLPLVEDARLPEEPPTVGSYLSTIDLLAMRQLLALDQELLGSRAKDLALRVDDGDGYVLESNRGWRALFGHYTLTVQPPGVIPAQVQCLQWLLAAEERQLEQVRLAVSADSCGTFTRFDDKPAKGG